MRVSRNRFSILSGGAIMAGGVRTDAHHPSNPNLTNRDLTIAETLNRVTNEQAGYVRTKRASGGLSSNDQGLVARDLPVLRQQVYNAHGRKARHRGV